MAKIQKVIGEIRSLHDFYKRTKSLRDRIKEKDLERSKARQKEDGKKAGRKPFGS